MNDGNLAVNEIRVPFCKVLKQYKYGFVSNCNIMREQMLEQTLEQLFPIVLSNVQRESAINHFKASKCTFWIK